MTRTDLSAPRLFLNRELSWLEFNDRVLQEGLNESLPLLERLRHLAFVSSNFDEFFMVRVAGLIRQVNAGVRKRDASGLSPVQQLAAISERVHRMVGAHAAAIEVVLGKLAESGLKVLEPERFTSEQRRFLRAYFVDQILPALTPLAVEKLSPGLVLPTARLVLGLLVTYTSGPQAAKTVETFIVVPVPTTLARLVTVPAREGVELTRLEAVIAQNIDLLFPGGVVVATTFFRVTRDADLGIDEDDGQDLPQAIAEAVRNRRHGTAVRLELGKDPDPRIRNWLMYWLDLPADAVYEGTSLFDAAALWELVNRQGFGALRLPDWTPQPPQDLAGNESLWQVLIDRDVLLVHPYESFDPVVQMVQEAAVDPNVLSIKMVLYRTSGDSPIIPALERAAASGKEVTVLVEIRARFDETRNIRSAHRLEEAGCHVIYGIAGLKTHAKVLLVVRRDGARLQRFAHLSTGNYNDRTACLYSDVGLMTSDRELCDDIASFFNLLTGSSEAVGWAALIIAPTDLRRRMLELIDREARLSTPERPGLIMAKVNSLEDKQISQALMRASQAGVRVMLNVRGICCLRPGVEGVSENVEARSIVGRYLEHARIFYFRNAGHEEVYLGSADWMGRNLDKRFETLFPIRSANLRRRLVGVLATYFADNEDAWRLKTDGSYERVPRTGPAVRAQEELHEHASFAVRDLAGVYHRPDDRHRAAPVERPPASPGPERRQMEPQAISAPHLGSVLQRRRGDRTRQNP